MQTLGAADYRAIAKKIKNNYGSEMQIEHEKNGCVFYVVLIHIEEGHNEIGTSFGGIDEVISVCDKNEYQIIEVECQDENYDTVAHNFDSIKLLKLLNS